MKNWTIELAAARDAARRAGAMLRDQMKESFRVDYKGEVDLVTDCDLRAQKLVFDHLSGLFPEYSFLAEEGLDRVTGSDSQWIVDPLDGTTNFAHRFPVFCVSIGLKHRDDVVVAVVYDPTRDEEYSAVRGEGAFLNGLRLSVSSVGELDRSLLATGFPYDIRRTRSNIGNFQAFLTRAQAVRRCGSAALDLCYVAAGRFDGFWELKLNPWDVAAGGLMIREAGGRTTDFAGNPMRTTFSEVVASNGLIHDSMLATLKLGLGGDGNHDRT